ncbi:MATE family efflux transporter [Fibrobacterales bacterium]|nr:MATE family efflux transporter [Fibrobacterales bacterium]
MNHATDRIGTEGIGKLLVTFSVPAIIGMIVNAVYSITDRIFVGQGVNHLGIAAITVTMPILFVIMAASMLIGIGSNSLFSIRLGEGKRNEVENIMGHAFVLLLFVPGFFIILILAFLPFILTNILSVSAELYPYAESYLRINMYGAVFFAMGPGINHFIRSDGHPKTSMLTQILGAAVNIVLDAIFIFVFDWGIEGAAWATVIAQFVSFLWVMYYFNSRHTALRFRWRKLHFDFALSRRIMAIGFAPAAMQLAIGFVNVLLNNQLFKFGGDIAVASVGIAYSIFIMVWMPLQGIGAGMQPIIGYNYGAKKLERVKRAFKLAVFGGTCYVFFMFLAIRIFPDFLISLFTQGENELQTLGTRALHICSLMMPLIAFSMLSGGFFQSLGMALKGSFLSLSRQIIFYIPLLFILPRFFGLDGVFAAMPAADFCAFAMALVFVSREFRALSVRS